MTYAIIQNPDSDTWIFRFKYQGKHTGKLIVHSTAIKDATKAALDASVEYTEE